MVVDHLNESLQLTLSPFQRLCASAVENFPHLSDTLANKNTEELAECRNKENGCSNDRQHAPETSEISFISLWLYLAYLEPSECSCLHKIFALGKLHAKNDFLFGADRGDYLRWINSCTSLIVRRQCGDITNDQFGFSEETVFRGDFFWGGNLPIYWVQSCHLVSSSNNSGQVCHTTFLPHQGVLASADISNIRGYLPFCQEQHDRCVHILHWWLTNFDCFYSVPIVWVFDGVDNHGSLLLCPLSTFWLMSLAPHQCKSCNFWQKGKPPRMYTILQ